MFKRALLTSSCLLSFAVFADESPVLLEPMTVTAQVSTAPSFNNEALSKTELSGDELPERGMNRLQDAIKNIANFSVANQGVGSFRQVFTMRGLVNTPIFSQPAVVFYVDDVAYSGAASTMGLLYDIDSIDVYRGSQPGLFGKNAYGGAVNIQTRLADNTLKSGVALEWADYDSYLVTAKSSGALIQDTLFFNVSGVYNQRDGFLNNTFLNNRPDAQENFSGKAALTWKPNRGWDIRLTLTKDDFNYGNARFTLLNNPERFNTAADLHEQLQQNANSSALRISYDSSDYQLIAVSSHRFWQMSPFAVDLDLSPAAAAVRYSKSNEETWTQELRITPKTQGAWNWQLGGFYSTTRQHINDDSTATMPIANENSFAATKNTDDYALFGRLAYQGITDLTLYSELRLDYLHSDINSLLETILPKAPNSFFAGHYETLFASPKWGMDYRLSSQALLYASTGFGFKPGGFSYAAHDVSLSHFAQESLWHNTLGIKTSWFNARVKSNLAAFYYQIANYQIERSLANGNYSTFNAPHVTSYGFELENQAEVLDHLFLESNVGYTHSRFDHYYDSFNGADYTGNPVPFVPEFNASTALQYKHPQGYFARIEWLWQGKTYFNETRSDVFSQNAYSLLNLRIGYAKNGYSGYLFAHNVTDSYYYSTKFGARGVPGDPRLIGLRLAVDF